MFEEFEQKPAENDAENSGPIEGRLADKNWSVRAKAFEDLGALFKSAKSPNEDIFKEHAPSWKKYLGDNNPGSLEKCLEALEAFTDKADP
jgi:hypothetical protein